MDLTDADDDPNDNPGTPYAFVVMSGNSPMLIGTANNEEVRIDMEALSLTPRDDTSKEYDLLDWFSDPNDIFLTFRAEADPTKFCKDAADPCAETDDVAVATATIATGSSDLTVALTANAKGGNDSSNVAIWVFADDSNGEYARKQINLTVGASTNPFVMTALKDVVLRQDDLTNTTIPLAGGFMDPDVATGRIACGANRDAPIADCAAQGLEYSVTINDAAAAKVGTDTEFTWVTSYMTAAVTITDDAATDIGHTGASVEIRPRVPGAATFTVTATDKGLMCKAGFLPAYLADHDNNPVTPKVWAHTSDIPINPSTPAGLPSVVTKCLDMNTGGRNTALADQKLDDLFPDAKSVMDAITVTIVSSTSPKAKDDIPAQEVVADKEAITLDLEDMNGEEDGEPAAFEDPTDEGLTYTLTGGDDIAMLSVEEGGSVVTIAPIWRAGDETKTVTVKATNNLDEESLSSTFDLTVKSATVPVVNMSPVVQAVLAAGFKLATGADPMVIHLLNLTGEEDEDDRIALFIDPNAKEGDALPGGLLFKMQVVDVVADHVYENQSMENDVTTSAMRLVLDPSPPSPTLTITPTGANSASVTVWGIDRERLMISATTMITVVSCDGVDMSDPCDGVTVGTEDEELPTEVALSQNYPNPFNPQTTIDYALPKAGDVSLIVYDMLGREVDVLLDGPQAAGRHTVRFGANHLPNGTYVYRLVAADKTITRTMVLVK